MFDIVAIAKPIQLSQSNIQDEKRVKDSDMVNPSFPNMFSGITLNGWRKKYYSIKISPVIYLSNQILLNQIFCLLKLIIAKKPHCFYKSNFWKHILTLNNSSF